MTEQERLALKVGDRVILKRFPGSSGSLVMVTGTVSKLTSTQVSVAPDPWAIKLMTPKVFILKTGTCVGENCGGRASWGTPSTSLCVWTPEGEAEVQAWRVNRRKQVQAMRIVEALSKTEVVEKLTPEQVAAMLAILKPVLEVSEK